MKETLFSLRGEGPLKLNSVLWAVRYAGLLALAFAVMIFWAASRRLLQVDDAFMFYRYALHFREGLGIAWNATGGPTYGLTSLGWFFAILPFSYLPLPPATVLVLASSLTCMIALALMSWGVTRFAISQPLRSVWVVVPLATIPLLASWHFGRDATNGMETMLSFLANVLLVLAALRMMREATARNALLLARSGYFAFFVRPGNGWCATMWKKLAFLSQYEVLDQAFLLGVAIRKASPRRQIIEHSFAHAWAVLYPHTEMSDYRVQGLHMPLILQAQSGALSGQR